jgi:uncharacterized membrane protein
MDITGRSQHSATQQRQLQDWLRDWGPLTAIAAALAYGMSRRSSRGVCAAVVATPLAYRAISGRWPPYVEKLVVSGYGHDSRAALSGDRGIHVRDAVRIERPLDEVYRFWRRLENLPRFMAHVHQVTDLGNGRSHWVVKGPGGIPVEWDAEIINEVEGKVIGWRSLANADVVTAGSVNFVPARGGRSTDVLVHLQYSAPGGIVAAVLAKAFGREPSQTIREELRTLKQLLEAGEVPRTMVETETARRRAR